MNQPFLFLPKRLLSSIVVLFLTCSMPRAQERPSLDSLVVRVTEYWDLLQKGKKAQAMEYVEKARRDAFLARQIPGFEKPRVSRLDPASDFSEVTVTVTVTRVVPPLTSAVDWPVQETWLHQNGDWYVKVVDDHLPFSSLPGAQEPARDTEKIRRERERIRGLLTFEKSEFDFGTVKRGEAAVMILGYQLSGKEAMTVRFGRVPPDLSVKGLSDRKLSPGRGRMEISLGTANYDGEVNETLRFSVLHGGIQVPYEFTIRGSVYTPISVLPSVLKLRGGEYEKELLLRNNSDKEVRVVGIAAETAGTEVYRLPLVLRPGETGKLILKTTTASAKANHQESVMLSLEQSVEGVRYLIVPVIHNYVEPKHFVPGSLNPGEIEDLIRKSKP